MPCYIRNVFIFFVTFFIASFLVFIFHQKYFSTKQSPSKVEPVKVFQAVNKIKKKKTKDCGCSEKPELNELIFCDTTTFKNNAKLYRRFDCDSSWLTFENNRGHKRILYSLNKDLIGLTGRLGYVFVKEYKNSLLFQNRQTSGGGFPINHELLSKENGKVIEEFGGIIHYSDKANDNFVLYLSSDFDALVFYDVDSQAKHNFSIPSKRIKKTIEKANTMFPEFLFEEPIIENNNLKITYKYFDRSAPDNWSKDTIKIDLDEFQGRIEKRFEKYLSKHEIKPLKIIKNDYGGPRSEYVETIKVSNHKIKWFHSFYEIKIKINNDLFTLENKSSLNKAHDEGKIDGKIVNNWDEIKFYKVNGRELIAIRMSNDPCTGLMCSVSYFLVYDLKTKSKNFFGTFKTDYYLGLYDFKEDGRINYLSKHFKSNGSFATENETVYNLYTLNSRGKFRLQRDNRRNPYFIKRVFDSDNYLEIEEKFKQNWIEKIK